jgi:hypothetical protein
MPWPAIAAIAGKVLAGGAAAGAAGGAAGAGAAGAAGGAAGGGGMLSGLMGGGGGGGLMSKMGGMMGGGGSGGGGGISGMIPQIGKSVMGMMQKNKNQGHTAQRSTPANQYLGNQTATETMNVARGGKIKRPSYQMGGMSPEFFDYLGKLTGQGLQNAGQTMDYADTQGIQNAVQGAEQSEIQLPENFGQAPEATGNVVPEPGANQGPKILGSPAAMGAQSQNLAEPMPGQESQMDQVVNTETQQLEQMQAEQDANSTGDAAKGAFDKVKSGDVIGAGLMLADHFIGKRSANREMVRQEQIAQGLHDQQQQRGSVYANQGSVYSAKHGAAIPGKMKQNNNLTSMMNYRAGGMAPADRVPRSERVEWGEYWNSQDTRPEGNYQPAMSRDRKGAREVKRMVNQRIRQGYVDSQGTDYGQFKRVKTKDFMAEADLPSFKGGGELPEKKTPGSNIPTVTIPLPDGNSFTPSVNSAPNFAEQNMLGMMGGGSTKMGYKNGGPGDPPDSTMVLMNKTTKTSTGELDPGDKPFQLVRKTTKTSPTPVKQLKVKTVKTGGNRKKGGKTWC